MEYPDAKRSIRLCLGAMRLLRVTTNGLECAVTAIAHEMVHFATKTYTGNADPREVLGKAPMPVASCRRLTVHLLSIPGGNGSDIRGTGKTIEKTEKHCSMPRKHW